MQSGANPSQLEFPANREEARYAAQRKLGSASPWRELAAVPLRPNAAEEMIVGGDGLSASL